MTFKKLNLKQLDKNYKKKNKLMYKKIRIVNTYIKKSKNLLDLGMGTGALIELVKNKFEEIYGIDLDKESINMCIKKFQKENFKIIRGDILEIDKLFNNMKFNYITALDVLEHLSEKNACKVLNSINHLLKNNGILIFSGPGLFEKFKIRIGKSPYHIFSHSSFGWMKMIRDTGLRILQVEAVEFPFINSVLLRKRFHIFGKCCVIVAQKKSN